MFVIVLLARDRGNCRLMSYYALHLLGRKSFSWVAIEVHGMTRFLLVVTDYCTKRLTKSQLLRYKLKSHYCRRPYSEREGDSECSREKILTIFLIRGAKNIRASCRRSSHRLRCGIKWIFFVVNSKGIAGF